MIGAADDEREHVGEERRKEGIEDMRPN